MPSLTADAVVVGAGVIGSSIALELARLGRRVAVLDKAGGVGHGSTSSSSGIVRFNYSTLAGVATAWEAKHYWEGWAEHLGARRGAQLARYTRVGVVMLDVDVAPRERVTPLFDTVGVPYEHWDASRLRAWLPAIDTGRHWPPKPIESDGFLEDAPGELGALFTPDGGFVGDPQLAAQNLATAARDRGATFHLHRAVTDVSRAGGRTTGVVLDDGSRVSAPVVVNATGPWSTALNRMAGVEEDFRISLRPMRQEVHEVPAPGYRCAQEGVPMGPVLADLDLGTYLRPAPGGRLTVGGTEPECDPVEWVEDPDLVARNVTPRVFRAQVTRAARRLTDLTVPNVPSGVVGVYDVADDWTPIYDRTALDGFYVAVGTSGNQFKNAPLVGRFLATLIEGVEGGHDHDADPIRYHCVHTGHDIDLGAYSRTRTRNAASSGTVMG